MESDSCATEFWETAGSLVFFGLFGAGVVNCLMGFAGRFPEMIMLWGINGYLQAMIWPPLIRIFAERYTEDRKMKYIVNIASSMAIGTLMSYFLSAGTMKLWGWEAVFFTAAGVMLPLAILWIFGFRWINRVSGNAEGISGEGTTVIAEKQTKTVHEK